MNRDQFQVYINHFNNKEYDAVTGYFNPNVTVEYYDDATYAKPAKTLHGRQAFADNYKLLHSHTREFLELGAFMTSGNLMFVELYTEFLTFKDSPPEVQPPLKKGTVRIMTNWVLYTMDEQDKMKHIRIAHFRMHDPGTAKYLNVSDK